MDYETIKYEKEDSGIVVITMNRPHRMNAMNRQFQQDFHHAHHQILSDPEVNAWVLTGAPRPDGRPCFSAGGDLREDAEGIPRWENSDYLGSRGVESASLFPVGTPAARLWDQRPRYMDPMFTLAVWSPKISIAAVDGVATAGGIELALSCDIIIASETAQFGDSHVKNLKIAIGAGSVSTALTRRVGYSKALEICLTGDFLDGKEAKAIGLANYVYPPGQMLDQAKALARKIAGMRPAAVAATKLSCRSVFDTNFNETWQRSDEMFRWLTQADPEIQAGLAGQSANWATQNQQKK